MYLQELGVTLSCPACAFGCGPCKLRSAGLWRTGFHVLPTLPCPGAPGSSLQGSATVPPKNLAPPFFAGDTCVRQTNIRQMKIFICHTTSNVTFHEVGTQTYLWAAVLFWSLFFCLRSPPTAGMSSSSYFKAQWSSLSLHACLHPEDSKVRLSLDIKRHSGPWSSRKLQCKSCCAICKLSDFTCSLMLPKKLW